MTSTEIHSKVKEIITSFSEEEFIYDLLLAYGTSKTSVTRLKKGDFNLSKKAGELLYKKKIFFKVGTAGNLLATVEAASADETIRHHQPRFVVATDYQTLVAKDLRIGSTLDIELSALADHYQFFLPLAGAEVYQSSNDNEADRNAAYKMAQLYDVLITENRATFNSLENVHGLNVFLSRLLFCFFAEDTGIFEVESIFTNTLVQHTAENGSDTHIFLNTLFDRLNSRESVGFPAHFAEFPYVNGGLFRDKIDSPVFTGKARNMLIELGDLDWQNINPDIFGSMIQAVVMPEYRSDLGMHYTSVPNILRVIKPLFLDELYEAFENSKTVNQLKKLIQRIAQIRFFDPACGSGNFLIITYKEIRRLEVEILLKIIELEGGETLFVDSHISLNQFYGIEIDDFAHEVAILSMWLAEHQMNQYFEDKLEGYTEYRSIIPLKNSGNIVQGNAARVDWERVCPIDNEQECYIIGNPPYLGYSRQSKEQKDDMAITFSGIKNYKKLDYISCWFYKASEFIQGKNAKYAFVSTNSLTQGEQVALMWPLILNKEQEIFFAYQSFKWSNNAKVNAGVAVVILGVRNNNDQAKYLYNENIRQTVRNISPYLTNNQNVYVVARSKPLSGFPIMIKGSSPGDNGNLLMTSDDKDELIRENPKLEKFLKKYIGAKEFIDGYYRYCIHITDDLVKEAYQHKELAERFEKVKEFRLESTKQATNRKAETPYFFDEDKYQNSDFILIPQTGSERRDYIPIGFFDNSYVPSNAVRVLYSSEPWLFAILSSIIHNVWVKAVAGRLKTDMQYSNTLCYNTFPFPDISPKQEETLNQYVFDILDEREKHAGKTMAQLYDPDKMPAGLLMAHQALDRAVEQCYRLQPFNSDSERLEYLFKLYEEMIAKDTLFAKQRGTRKRRK